MSVSPVYLEAAATVAAAARDKGHLQLLVNMSQMTVSQMDLTSVAESRQQRLHWLAEQILNWSGLPVTHVRPTVFMENPLFGWVAVASIVRESTIRPPVRVRADLPGRRARRGRGHRAAAAHPVAAHRPGL